MKATETNKEPSNFIHPHRNISERPGLQRLLRAGNRKNWVLFPQKPTNTTRALAEETAEVGPIYVVDDEPRLTELYTIVLEAAGYVAKPFIDRVEALAALKGDIQKPELLILDYLGHPMPTERFMERCRVVHPMLRILLASGFSPLDARLSSVRPDRFLQKPFTAEAFLREVREALAG